MDTYHVWTNDKQDCQISRWQPSSCYWKVFTGSLAECIAFTHT